VSRRTCGLIAFLLLAFGITWTIEIGLLRRVVGGSTPYQLALVGVMFVPALCAVIARLFVEREGFGDAGLRWGRGRYYLWAWLLPIGFGLAAMGLAILLRQAEFDPWMTELMVRIRKSAPTMKIPPIHLLRIYFIAGSLTQAVVFNTIPCFGEEFGWRGYLLVRLLPLGTGRALVLSGAIWGLWHAPIVLRGHSFPDHPQLGVLLMTTFCVLLGVVLGWLRLASGSVFPAAVGHASINGPASTTLAFLRGRSDITTAVTGLLGQAVMAAFILAIWRFGAFRRDHLSSEGERDASDSVPQPEVES